MAELKRRQANRATEAPDRESMSGFADTEDVRTVDLREEQLIARKELRERGEIEVRTVIDEVPGRLEADAYREEVVIEHEPVGQMVSEREQPREEGGTLIVPVYEEQLVVTKRLVLKERIRVRRVGTTERQLFQETLRRERVVVEDPEHTGLVREQYPSTPAEDSVILGRSDAAERPDAERLPREPGPKGPGINGSRADDRHCKG